MTRCRKKSVPQKICLRPLRFVILAVKMSTDADSESPKPEIVEYYRDFVPPSRVRPLVEELLEAVPANYLRGLKRIVLSNQNALTRDQRRQKVWARKGKYPLAKARGAYYRTTKSSPATVWLYVDNILKRYPPWILRVPVVRFLDLGEVLYHEIGHHIHATHLRVYDGKENIAEHWSRKLGQQFFRKRYWYVAPFASPLSLLIRLILKASDTWAARKRQSGTLKFR